ncbi:MAG: SDR family oxidoreductase [Anaerolineales bacterium]
MDRLPLALVTGAARRLGRLFALTLARRGYGILLHYHASAAAAAQTAEEIRALGVFVQTIRADLADPLQVPALFAAVDAAGGSLDVLVNSAAIMRRSEAASLSLADWEATLAVNLRAPFLLAQQAVERMTNGGLIVNLTDVGAQKAWSGYVDYVVSKAGLEALTRLLAKAFAPRVRVNAIAPGLVLPADDFPAAQWESLVGRTPLRRPVRPEDVAAALEFLLDNASITGQIIAVDGGYSLV